MSCSIRKFPVLSSGPNSLEWRRTTDDRSSLRHDREVGMTLTVYDAAMAGVVVAGMIWGAWRGVTWQLAGIASLILGYIASHQLAPQLTPRFGTDPVISRTL